MWPLEDPNTQPEGWVTFSVPVPLTGGQKLIGDVIPQDAVEIAYKYDPNNRNWVQVTDENNFLVPLEAVYIKLKKAATAIIRPTTSQTAPPVRSLTPGSWNLIGATDNRDVASTLASLGYNWSVMVSPSVNPSRGQ